MQCWARSPLGDILAFLGIAPFTARLLARTDRRLLSIIERLTKEVS